MLIEEKLTEKENKSKLITLLFVYLDTNYIFIRNINIFSINRIQSELFPSTLYNEPM